VFLSRLSLKHVCSSQRSRCLSASVSFPAIFVSGRLLSLCCAFPVHPRHFGWGIGCRLLFSVPASALFPGRETVSSLLFASPSLPAVLAAVWAHADLHVREGRRSHACCLRALNSVCAYKFNVRVKALFAGMPALPTCRHLIEGTVFTTAEVVLAELSELKFERKMDERTGFPELEVLSENLSAEGG